MKTIALSVLWICIYHLAYAQVSVEGPVIDASSKQIIPYVNIGINNSSSGTVSDQDGNFQLTIKSEEDIIIFSSIGYELFQVNGAELADLDSIQLTPTEYEIAVVEVLAHKYDSVDILLGVKNKTRGLSIGFGSSNLGTEIGALIAIEKSTLIQSANFVLNHAKGDSLLFRVNIYNYQDGQIGANLLQENILIETKQRRGVISVDLSDLNLVLKNDVLLSLEWIKDDGAKGNTGITFDTKKARKLPGVQIKKTSIGGFEPMGYIQPKLKPCFYFMGRQLVE